MEEKKHNIFYGYDDYDPEWFYSDILKRTSNLVQWQMYQFWSREGQKIWYPVKDNDKVNKDVYHHPEIEIEEHPELLDNAKKLYIHPNCKISRDAVRKKYKICLNPWLADAVIIPENGDKFYTYESYMAVFENEGNKKLLCARLSPTYNASDINIRVTLMDTPLGTKLIDCVPGISKNNVPENVRNAELIYVGPVMCFGNTHKHIFDYLTLNIPQHKIVFQETLNLHLGDESNKPTFESMYSIYEMLKSSDPSIVSVGLKTLAALDYANYPNSTMTILNSSGNWEYNNTRNASAVRFMLQTLGIKCAKVRYRSYSDKHISKKDYELFQQLIKAINKWSEQDYVQYCFHIPFVYIDDKFNVIPRLTEEVAAAV